MYCLSFFGVRFSLPLYYLLVIVLFILLQITGSRCRFSICQSLYCLFFFNLRFLLASFVSFSHCIVCYSFVYSFSLSLQYLLNIVLFVILLFIASCCLFCIFQSLNCLLFFYLRLLVASLVSFNHCIVCPFLAYGFLLPLQYLSVIVLFVLWCTASRCPLIIFQSLYCLYFFNLQLLVAPLLTFSHCIVCPSLVYVFSLPLQYLLVIVLFVLIQLTVVVALLYLLIIVLFVLFWFTAFDCSLGNIQSLYCLFFFALRLHVAPSIYFSYCIVCPSLLYSFSLPLQYPLIIVLFVLLQFTASRCLFCIFYSLYCLSFFGLRFLVSSFVFFSHCIVCPSFVYGFLLPLQYFSVIVLLVILLFTASRCLFSIFYSLYCLSFFGLRFLVASFVSFSHCIVCPSFVYDFSLSLQYCL